MSTYDPNTGLQYLEPGQSGVVLFNQWVAELAARASRNRTQTVTSASTITANADSNDRVLVTALAANLTVNNPTTAASLRYDGQKMEYRIKCAGTGKTIAWDTEFRAIGVTLPLSIAANKTIYVITERNNADSKWDVLGVDIEA